MFDLSFSFLVLVFLFPLFFLIGLLIFLSSPGKVIFSQERIGKQGKLFKCYKFRTMHPNAEEKLEEILNNNFSLKAEWNQKQKLQDDPRVFLLGKWLRKSSLDELPQFWNVIKGDLSVVGPRPYIVSQASELGTFAHKILSMRPGITGLWQTSGRNRTTFKERIELDARYVELRSFKLDLYLILKTIPLLFFSKDAY